MNTPDLDKPLIKAVGISKDYVIGDNVVMYANSMILGNLNIPSNKTLPANTIIK